MSHYVEVKVRYKDQAALVEALKGMFGDDQVEVHTKPVELRGYGSQRSEAHVVVRKQAGTHSGLRWGDAGWLRQQDGTYTQVADNLDAERLRDLPQLYARAATVRQAKLSGYTVVETRAADGALVLKLTKWETP